MSSNLPPTGPPTGPPASGPRPSGPPELLDSGAGAPVPPDPRTSGRGRRRGIIGGGAILGLALVGGGAFWAWSALLATGPQPAEALPDSTIGYVSIDLDPSGKQKLEALETLKKFPAFEDELGLDTDDDLRKRIFEEVQDADECGGLDYAADVEPWLGDRMAVAAADLGEKGEDGAARVTPLLVVQVSDEDAADKGLSTILDECAGGSDGGLGGWSISNGWAVIAETDELAEKAGAAAADAPLSQDDDFQKWTGEAGDPGILTAYAAPAAGGFIADELGSFPLGLSVDADETGLAQDPDDLPAAEDLLESFDGAALTVRFDDGSLEIETASGTGFLGLDALTATDRGDDVLATLPDDTAAAFGLGFEQGWVDEALDYAVKVSGGDVSADELIAQAEEETGLSLPEDAETLAGESAAVAVSSEVDPDAVFGGDLDNIGVGVKIKGDSEAIEEVLDRIRGDGRFPEEGRALLETASDDEHVVLGPDADYRERLLEDGDLADNDVYRDVVRESGDAASILFVDFDAGDWLAGLAGDDEGDVAKNLEPLAGLGVSGWTDDEVGHVLIRVTTN